MLAVLGLLGSVQLVSLAGGRAGSQADRCRDNLRRLAQAWVMYADDNGGKLTPNNGSNTTHPRGTWAAGWLDYTSSFDNINTDLLIAFEKTGNYGHLGPYLQRDFSVFRCTTDTSTVELAGRLYNRVRSVSMNGWMGGDAYCGGNGGNTYLVYRQLSEVTVPAQRWVLIEESLGSLNDSWFAIRLGDMVGGRWLVDYPGSQHGGGAWLNFADGHVEYRRWLDPRTLPVIKPGELFPLQVPMNPPNPDMAWLQERTSGPR